ncbi:MAG: hypothetical protein ACQESG_07025 [Nanobdellota archaeon]
MKYLYFIAIIAAFFFPQFSHALKPYLIPILILMMTLSTKDLEFSHFRDNPHTVRNLILTNYVLLSGLYILLAFIFIKNTDYRNTIWLLGIMPPAVGIIPLSYMLKGDAKTSFIAEFIAYMIALVYVPIVSLILFQEVINPLELLKVLCMVLIIPLGLSRIIRKLEKQHLNENANKLIITVLYSISFFIIIGVNKEAILQDLRTVTMLVLVLSILKFGIGTVTYIALKQRISYEKDVIYILFATFKNGGAAMAIALMLFGIESTLPLAINAMLVPAYILFLEMLLKDKFSSGLHKPS